MGGTFVSSFHKTEKLDAYLTELNNPDMLHESWKWNWENPYRNIGYYGGIGFDYHLGNDHFIFFKVNYEALQELSAWHLKLGYTF